MDSRRAKSRRRSQRRRPHARSSKTIVLCRSVCEAEFQELMGDGPFRSIPGSLEGKWFAETARDAMAWGEFFARISGVAHDRIISIEIDGGVAAEFWRVSMLDGI